MTSDSVHTVHIANILNDTSNPDPVAQASGIALGYPRVDSSAVSLVRDEATCQAAAAAYAAEVPSNPFAPLSGKVFVFRVGPSHYVVTDPEYRHREHLPIVILFTTAWARVAMHG